MAIVPKPSNTILLFPPHQVDRIENRYKTSVAATPGKMADMADDGGVLKWRIPPNASESNTLAVYLENGMMNKGIDDDWAADDLTRVALLQSGDIFNALLPSGQNISYGEKLQINTDGTGTLITASNTTAAANIARFQSLDAPGAVTVLTRCRVQVIG